MNRPTAQPEPLDSAAHAVADPTRRHILRLVRDHEVSAGDLARHFSHLSRPAVSQHLRVLRDANLVTVQHDGKRRLYRGRPDGLAEMRDFVDEMWTDSLNRLKVAAEQLEWPARQRTKGRPR